MKEIEDSVPSDYNPRNDFDARAYSVDQDFANDDIWDDAPPLEEESSVGQAEEEEALGEEDRRNCYCWPGCSYRCPLGPVARGAHRCRGHRQTVG